MNIKQQSRHPIIALAGRARTGKDTVAGMLLELGVSRYRYSFADPLRRMLFAGLGIDCTAPDFDGLKDVPHPLYGCSPRRLLQTLGTEWGRQIVHPDLWLLCATREYRERGPGMVIADCRFENEAGWIRDAGGLVIHIWRGVAPHVESHASERGVEIRSGDAVIANNGSLDELREQVEIIFCLQETA